MVLVLMGYTSLLGASGKELCPHVKTADVQLTYCLNTSGCLFSATQQIFSNKACLVTILDEKVSNKQANKIVNLLAVQIQKSRCFRDQLASGIHTALQQRIDAQCKSKIKALALFIEDQYCLLDIQNATCQQSLLSFEQEDIALPSSQKPSFHFNVQEWLNNCKQAELENSEATLCSIQ